MGKKETIEILIEGGKAKADASLAQKLGPMRINLQEVLKVINEKTHSFSGMRVPVKVIVDPETKDFEISIGTPPTAELIKKEIGIDKGSSFPNKDKVANVGIEQIIKIARMKESSILHNSLKSVVKTIIGSCNSLGILVEGKEAEYINKDVDEGKYDNEINQSITETNPEKKKILKQQLDDFKKKYLGDVEQLKAKVQEKKVAAAEKKKEEPKK